jgi:MFS transporter, NNP family, nitrate/nitrite transporter
MYWVFGLSLVCCLALSVPQMDLYSPGSGLTARFAGTVQRVSAQEIVVVSPQNRRHCLPACWSPAANPAAGPGGTRACWCFPAETAGRKRWCSRESRSAREQLLARGVTQIFFQANIWIFTGLSLLLGAVMGIGKAAVYRHIPDYFPQDVGVVGGIVGVLGGLGGFVCPVIFGYLLKATGLWTSCWMFLFVVVAVCLVWMHLVIRRMLREQAPHLMHQMERSSAGGLGADREST